MKNDMKSRQTQDTHTDLATTEQHKLPYSRPIITKLDLGTEEVGGQMGYGSDGGRVYVSRCS